MTLGQALLQRFEIQVKSWTKPGSDTLIGGTAADLLKSRAELIAENAFLRQQIILLKRQTKQPQLTPWDRGLLVLLARVVRGWKSALLLVKPDTLLGWHRQGFKLFWRSKSKGTPRPPRISAETIALIQQMAMENRQWGVKRIRGELLKLGIRVNRGTVRHYIGQARYRLPPQPHGQSWTTFLANHAIEIWACDFVQTYDWLFRTIFLFFIIEHHSRRVVHVGVTRSPSDAWVAQQLREATPFGTRPRFLLCDRDDKYGPHFELAAAGIDILRTPPCAPKANAICERFIGSVRRECLDFVLLLSEVHARRVVGEYVRFFNQDRPHQGLDQQIPAPAEALGLPDPAPRRVMSRPILGGLQHDYRWVA
jgi:transposase InsO family protein